MFILKYGVRPGLMLIMANIVGSCASWPINYNIQIEERKKERTERYSEGDMNLNWLFFFPLKFWSVHTQNYHMSYEQFC